MGILKILMRYYKAHYIDRNKKKSLNFCRYFTNFLFYSNKKNHVFNVISSTSSCQSPDLLFPYEITITVLRPLIQKVTSNNVAQEGSTILYIILLRHIYRRNRRGRSNVQGNRNEPSIFKN